MLMLLLACIPEPPMTDHEARIAALEAADVEADLAAMDQRIADLEALEERLAAAEAAVSTLNAQAVLLITEDQELVVGTQAALEDALASLDRYRIASNATVTVRVESAAPVVFNAPIHVGHPDGARIRIEGDEAALVTLSFTGSGGLELEQGQVLGYFGGFELVGDGIDDGIHVDSSAVLGLGRLQIDGFSTGIWVGYGAVVRPVEEQTTAGWLTVVNNLDDGVVLSANSVANLRYAVVSDNAGAGVQVSFGAFLYAPAVQSMRNGTDGILLSRGALMSADGLVASDNAAGTGLKIGTGSTVRAYSVTASGNRDGFSVSGLSYLDIEDAFASGNSGYDYLQDGFGIIRATGHTGDTDTYQTSANDDYTKGL